jgi:hypothetical protein
VKLRIESEDAVHDSDSVTNKVEEGTDKQAPSVSVTEAKEERPQLPRLSRQRWARPTELRQREGENWARGTLDRPAQGREGCGAFSCGLRWKWEGTGLLAASWAIRPKSERRELSLFVLFSKFSKANFQMHLNWF